MQIKEKKLYQEPHCNWARVFFISDDQKKSTTVLVYASEEYLEDNKIFIKSEKDKWLQGVIKKLEVLGNEIFKKEIYYNVYANDNDGKANGLIFLKNKIKF